MMSSPPSSVISPTMAATFDVPTSRPTRYRSLRATVPLRTSCLLRRPPLAAAAGRRTPARRTASRRNRSRARARAAPAPDPGTTAAAPRTARRPGAAAPVVVEHHDRVVRVADVDLRDAARSGLRGASASMTRARPRRARVVDRGAVRAGGPTRPSMIGRSNSAYCGPNSSITIRPRVDQDTAVPPRRRQADRRAPTRHFDRRRQTRRSARRRPTASEQPRADSRSRSAVRMLARAGRRAAPRPRRSTAARCRAPTIAATCSARREQREPRDSRA